MKTCPYCAEPIENSITVCPYCKSDLSAARVAIARPTAAPQSHSSAWLIAIIVGGVMMGFLVMIAVLIALLLPAVQQAREAARRTQCRNNLKMIGLALHNYYDTYDTFPPAYIADENGKPMHSWRVLILPFLEQSPLYKSYDFSQPWDSPANEFVLNNMPPVFACPSHTDPGDTNTAYAGVFGPKCIFSGTKGVSMRDIPDGMSSTLMVGEVSNAKIPWTRPQDIDVQAHPNLNSSDGFSSKHIGGVNFLTADGAVHLIRDSIAPQTLQNLFLRDDGNPVGDF